MTNPSNSAIQNLLPVQAYFDLQGNFQTFIGQGKPFYATIYPIQSGLTITNSTIDSSIIGGTTPAAGYFTSIATGTGTISTGPSGNTDITNKLYVDTVAQGLGPKAACQVGTLTNITLSGLQTIDGYTTLAGDRVLVKNQTTQADNGIYVAASGAWSRAADMDTWAEVSGAYTILLNGTQAETGWVCTSPKTGTLGVTAITFVQFSTTSTYYAGTGLTLASNTFSITPVGTAGTYGSASSVPVFVTNASGQVTSVTNTSIAIANTQVSGLGTMSTQNANAVAITGGSINGTTIGASLSSSGVFTTLSGTTITASTQFSGPGTGLTGTASGLSIGGNAATATSATSAGSVTNSITFNNSGSGGASGSTFNGSSALTVSYNTVGAPSTTGSGANGLWGISITGNAVTVTNGVYTTGSYSNPSWITSILGSIVSGAVASATTATNVAGGATGSLLYQSAASTTTSLPLGTTNYVLTAGASAPQYVAQSTLSVGSASTATTATNLAGGAASQIPYQTASGTTAFIANGTTGQFLTSNGSSAPTWTTASASVTISDQTSSASVFYPTFVSATSGTTGTIDTSSTKLQYQPSTGTLTSTLFSGSGASLTSIPNGALVNSSVTIGSTAVALGATVTTFAGLTSVTSTTFVGALTGNASSATTATTATNATNVAITDNTSSVSTYYPTIVTATSGNTGVGTSSTKLSFVPSTGALSATSFSGAGTGLTGTASGLSIGGNAATATSATSATSATTATNIAGGANLQIPYQTGSGTTSFVAAPTLPSTYLSYNGTNLVWAASAGVGTVTSVAQSFTGGLISVSGSPITTAGTLALTVAGTSGGIPYFSSGTTWASSAALTQYGVVYGGGAGNAPVSTAAGTTGQVLAATTSAAPSWSNISSLAITSVSGTTNQITASTTTGAVTLSLPTSITTGQHIANQSISGSATQGAFAYGTLNGSDTGIFASYQTSIAGYAYMALQNTSNNAAATTDIALYNDTASLGKYIDIGINSSGFTGTGNFSLANAGYIYTYGGDLALGTYSANGIHFIVNNGATDAMTISSTGIVSLGTALAVGSGGTGIATAPTAGSVVYGASTTAQGYTAAGTSGQVLISGGTGSPTWSTNIGGNAANVTGTVAVANGGTGSTTLTANNVLLGNGTSALQVVAPGTSGNVLTSNGTTWVSSAASGGGATITPTTTTGTYYVIGTTSTSGSLSVASISNTNVVSYNANTGALSAVSMVSSSDERLKDNINVIVDALPKVEALRGVSYFRNGLREIGVIAQEVEKIIPEVVQTGEDGYKTVAYGNIVGLLIEAVKELSNEVNRLKEIKE